MTSSVADSGAKARGEDATGAELAGRFVIVVGMGASGCAATALLLSHGARVLGTDSGQFSQLPERLRRIERSGVQLMLGGHAEVPWHEAALVVVSPGVADFEALTRAAQRGTEVIGETELAFRYLEAPVLAVGGTNGKSTVTTLLGHMVEASGLRTFVGGNLGEAACEAPGQGSEAVVLEVSSFQMERVSRFRPSVAILLNISEDHLDRYASFEDYAQAKGRCFERQSSVDFAVVPAGDERCREQAARGQGKLVTFGDSGDYAFDGKAVVEQRTGERFDLTDADLHGRHNAHNAAAAIAAARAFGLSRDAVEEGIRRFRALPHRMALVGHFRGVTFYDDSKATNVGAAVTALRGLTEPRGVLVAGGRDKLGSYDELVVALREKGRGAVLLGEAAMRLEAAIGGAVPVRLARTIQGAVVRAFDMAAPGDAVLLSPACSSLDMFKSYAERGERFAEAVRQLPELLVEAGT